MTSSIITFFIVGLAGFVLGMLYVEFMYYRKPDGYFIVNLVNPEDEMFKMQIDVPLEELPKAKYLIFKVRKVQ